MKSNKRSSNLNSRRKSALSRLEIQLKSGTKPVTMQKGVFDNSSSTIFIELTEKDIKRITKECEILKTSIK